MASRVPYESAARVLAQSHKSFAGYTVRHGLAITMGTPAATPAAARDARLRLRLPLTHALRLAQQSTTSW